MRLGLGLGLGLSAPSRSRGGGGGGAWVPTDIAGCQTWLRAEHGNVDLSGSQVVTWYDRSGQGRDYSQPTPANRFTYVEGVYNGHDTVRGSNDYARHMEAADWLLTGQATFVVVCSKTTLANTVIVSQPYWAGTFGSSTGDDFLWTNGADRLSFTDSASAGLHILTVTQVDGVSIHGYYDGAPAFSAVPSNGIAALTNIAEFVGFNGGAGDLSEFITWDTSLGSSDLVTVHTHLATRYGI